MAEGDVTIKDEVAAWHSAADKIREVVKWVASAFGALGALLIGTAPLTGFGDVEVYSLRFIVAVLLGVLALGSVAYVVWTATSLLAPSAVTLVDVEQGEEFSALRTEIAAEPSSYLGTWGTDVSTFVDGRDDEYGLLAAVDTQIAQGLSATDLPKLREAHKQLVARIEAMGRVSARLLAAAGFHHLANRFADAKPRMFQAAALAVVGIAGFVLTVGTADASADEPITKIPARVSLTEAGVRSIGPLLGEECTPPFQALVLGGGSEGPWDLLVTDSRCEAGEVTVEKTEGNVLLVFDE